MGVGVSGQIPLVGGCGLRRSFSFHVLPEQVDEFVFIENAHREFLRQTTLVRVVGEDAGLTDTFEDVDYLIG